MSRVSAASTVVVALGACNSERALDRAEPNDTRSERVVASSAPEAAARPIASIVSPASSPRTRRICDGTGVKGSPSLPHAQPARVSAPGESPLGALAPTAGRWTWINVFAAWCEPCKAEIPNLRAFSARAARAGHPFDLVFLSVDDDERQLVDFVRTQPPGGLRSTYWLREGSGRRDWLADVGVSQSSELPIQILVDSRGKVRCVEPGAVDDRDFDAVMALLAR